MQKSLQSAPKRSPKVAKWIPTGAPKWLKCIKILLFEQETLVRTHVEAIVRDFFPKYGLGSKSVKKMWIGFNIGQLFIDQDLTRPYLDTHAMKETTTIRPGGLREALTIKNLKIAHEN